MAYEATAIDFYHDLTEALGATDVNEAYQTMERTLRIAVEQLTRFEHTKFAGLFAKLSYIASEHKIDHTAMMRLNETRVRLRSVASYSAGQLEAHRRSDIKIIADFIETVYCVAQPRELDALEVAEQRRESGEMGQNCIRAIVSRWDEEYIYASTSDTESEIRIAYNETDSDHGWQYIGSLLRKYTQLNIVRPRVKEGIYRPELIIVEPDYLVDISAIARCFTEYADSSRLNMINKLRPQVQSNATLLGNFAGQLLDEAIHDKEQMRPYTESIGTFFRNNALGIATCTDLAADFHKQARRQAENIRRAIEGGLQKHIGAFDRDRVMVEPSFFSEMLGLQGRMDFLQLDYRVLIEQKSGKAAYPDNPLNLRQKEEHYAQLLLYMALLHYNYGIRNADISAFLLYSRYENGLIGLGAAPQLLATALRIRNEIAAAEISAAHDGFGFLEEWKSDDFNTKNASPRFWAFIKPQLDEVLRPIHEASPLERKYFMRFMQFVAMEHLLAKIGNDEKEGAGFAAKWQCSADEKRQAGIMIDRLHLVSPDESHEGAVESVVLRFGEKMASDLTNFRIGDIVILYPYDAESEPDARQSMVHRCSIKEITGETIELTLRAPQTDARVFRLSTGRLWAVEGDFFESSATALYRGMHSFLTAPKERRDLILGLRRPASDKSIKIRGCYGKFDEMAQKVKQARDLFLIIGPPGTGKTSFGMLNTLKEELCDEKGTVLITSYTNRAVDEICSKLTDEGIDFLRIGSEVNCPEAYRGYLLEERVKQCRRVDEIVHLIEKSRVIVGTTTSICSNAKLFQIKSFSLAIIDEASQILEPHIMGILCAQRDGMPAIGKFVMIGDHKQLPAVVQQSETDSRVDDAELQGIGLRNCRLSLFERMLNLYRGDDDIVFMLTRQGRMHREIADFPNNRFYNGCLGIVPLAHQECPLPQSSDTPNGIYRMLQTTRIAFVATPHNSRRTSDKVNTAEAEMIAATVVRAYHMLGSEFDIDRSIGVIVPYRGQIVAVRNAIARYGIGQLRNVCIDTVERYQGSQRDIIIYGFTIQRHYQLAFLTNNTFVEDDVTIDRKLNVAMTRARKHMLLFGNPELLRRNTLFSSLIDYCKGLGAYYAPELERYVEGKF